ncbi:hypothetical protein FGB62_363g01 [Gracilaria domingensis]|nr:hypothetical protein FGB62_363g01 [Gracilaria domingensis]
MSLRPRLGGVEFLAGRSASGRGGSGVATPVGATLSPSPTSSLSQGNGFSTVGFGTFSTRSIGSSVRGFSATGGEDQGILIACQNQVCVSEGEEYECDNMPSTIGDDIAWLYSDDRTQRPVVIQERGITRNENGIPINFAAVGNQPPITCNVAAVTSSSTLRIPATMPPTPTPLPPQTPFGSCCRPCIRPQRSLSCCRACCFTCPRGRRIAPAAGIGGARPIGVAA